MRRRTPQGVRLDRGDLQRIGLLSHRLARRGEEGFGLLLVVRLIESVELIGVVGRLVQRQWRFVLRFDIIEVRDEGSARTIGRVSGADRRRMRRFE
jgi:hypothetical protein